VGANAAFAGVVLLTLLTPFEATRPVFRLPWQSISNLEAALLLSFGAWTLALIVSTSRPGWRTRFTAPWLALVAAMAIASLVSSVSRTNGLHMTGRIAAAFGVFLLTVAGVTTRGRLRIALAAVVLTGAVVSLLALLEYLRLAPVLRLLTAFRPGLATVGAQVRAGGPLQYPTIASMYLEIVFAFGLGLLLIALDAERRAQTAAVFAALVLIAEAIALTFTRAGLITMAASLALVGASRYRARGRDRGVVAIGALTAVIATLLLVSRSTQSWWLRFTTEGQESWYRADILAPADIWMAGGEAASIPVTLINTGRLVWDSDADPPFYVSYHWLDAKADRIVAFEGLRTAFDTPVSPGSRVSMAAHVRAPGQSGEYRLVWDVVQEGRLWFTTEPGAVPVMSRAFVSGDRPPTALATFAPPHRTVRPRRLQLWRAAWRMAVARPLVGVGPDNFRLSYAPYAGLAAGDPRIHSNNMYLEVLAGAGLAGVLAFAWLLWSIARVTMSTVADPASLAIGAAVLAIAVHGTVDSFLSFASTYVLFAMTVGFAPVHAQFSTVDQRLTADDQRPFGPSSASGLPGARSRGGKLTVAPGEVEGRLHDHAYRV
jgi:hypothetical protein